MMKASCNILVVGGGAVGSIFGWRIAHNARHRVSVVCRSNYERVKRAGYFFQTTAWGSGHFKPRHVYSSDPMTRQGPRQRFDYVVCANKITKGYSSMLNDLRFLVQPETTLVSLQNGMDVELPLQRAFPNNTVLSAICNIGCDQVQAGFITQDAGINPYAFLIGVPNADRRGAHTRQMDSLKCEELVSMDSSFNTVSSLREERWKKLIFNSAWNSATALSGLDTHELLSKIGGPETVLQLATEAHRIAIYSGIKLDEDLPTKVINIARAARPITTSTLQDVRKGRPIELDPILGYLVSQASKVGVSVPALDTAHKLLHQFNESRMARQDPTDELMQKASPMPWRLPFNERIPSLAVAAA